MLLNQFSGTVDKPDVVNWHSAMSFVYDGKLKAADG